ncbi:MAG: protein rep [Acidimicrobiales bacterium]
MNWRAFGPRKQTDANGNETWTQELRIGSCGRPLGERVAISRAAAKGGDGHCGVFSGVETCGSATGCMRCARKVRAEKAGNIGLVIRTHLDRGGFALFLTLTFAHSLADSAEESLDDALTAWSTMVATRRWKKLIAWLGDRGWIRATETTHTDANGYHPHHHVCLLTDRAVGHDENDPMELEDLRQEIYDCWSLALDKLDREAHHSSIGVDLQPIRDDEGIGAYVSKVEFEIARGDLKRGRGDSRSMWQVGLDAADGCQRSKAIWADYVRAAKGRRWLSTSQGLWAEFGINDRTDEEIAEDQPDDPEPIAFFEPAVYMAAGKSEAPVLTELRHLVEANATVAVLALVLSRRLGRAVDIEYRPGDGGLPTIVWADESNRRSDE